MNKLILFYLLSIVSFKQLYATGQNAELIIYEGDTLQLLSLPLENYLGEYEEREKKYPFLKSTCSTALWRNYQSLWKLESNELYLIDVFLCADKTESIINELFETKTPIKANWYSGKLFIQHGKMIKYQHSAFERYYEEETVLEIDQGKIIRSQHFVNGNKPNDNGFTNNPDSIMAEVHRRINWKNLPDLSEDKKLYVRIKTGEQDSLTIIHSKASDEYIKEVQNVLDEFPQLKKFYSRGKPLEEAYTFPVIFSNQQRKRYAR